MSRTPPDSPIGSSWKQSPWGGISGSGIGYGPSATGLRSAIRSRSAMVFGLGVTFGVIFSAQFDVSVDTNRVGTWRHDVAWELLGGCLLAAIISRRVGVARRGGWLAALLGAVSALCSILLINTGNPDVIAALLSIATICAIPALALAAIDGRTQIADEPVLTASARPLVAMLAGVVLGSLVMFLKPELDWGIVCGLGGIIALLGAGGRLMSAERIYTGPIPTPLKPVDPMIATALSAAAGLLLVAPVVIATYLSSEFHPADRYQPLTIVIAASLGAAVALGLSWNPEVLQGLVQHRIVAALAIGVGALAMLFAVVSETLPGLIIGVGIASVGAIGALAITSARNTPLASTLPAIAAFALALLLWRTMSDALTTSKLVVDQVRGDAERWLIGLTAVPALIVAASAGSFTRRQGAPAKTPTDTEDSPAEAAGVDVAGEPILSVRGIEYSYSGVQVLFGIDVDVFDGEIVALLGANGAGKTTFLRTIGGLGTPERGTIRYGGEDLLAFSPDERVALGVNHIGAGSAVAEDLSVAENLAMFGYRLTPRKRHDRTAEVYRHFPRLEERKHQKCAHLSGGERQMLAISKAIILRPRLLVIDELSLGLAPIVVSTLVDVVREIHATGTSVLLVEQNVSVALELADRAVCMEKGEIVFESSAEELRADAGLLESVYLEGVGAALSARAETEPQR